MAIRLALGGGLRAHDGAGARLVLDEEGLAGALRKRVGEKPPDEIVAATGSDRDDDLHRVVGIIGLRLSHYHTERERHERGGDPRRRAANSNHRIPLRDWP